MNYNLIQDIRSDYFLETANTGFLKVIIPEEKINYVSNPLMQGISNFGLPNGFLIFGTSASSGSLHWDSSELQSPVWIEYYRIIPTSNSSSMYWINEAPPLGETVCSVLVRVGSDTVGTLRINFSDNTFQEKVYTLKRNVWTTMYMPVSGSIYSYGFTIAGRVTIDVAHWQITVGTKLQTPIHGYLGNGYSWQTYPHNSYSHRSQSVTDGGSIQELSDLGIILTEVEGLGATELDVNSTDLIGKINKKLLGISPNERSVNFGYRMYTRSLEQLVRQHSSLSQNILNINQPRTFIFSSDCYNLNAIKFSGVVTEGLNWEFNSFHGEELGLQIDMLSPLFEREYSINQDLQKTFAATNKGLLFYNGAMSTSPIQVSYTQIDTIHVGETNGQLYAAFYNGSVSTIYVYLNEIWTPIASTNANDRITALHQNGKFLYVSTLTRSKITGISPYTGLSGEGIARINLITKTVDNIGLVHPGVSTGDGSPVPHIKTMTTDSVGNLYVGGHFSAMTLSTTVTTSKIAVFYTSNAWDNLSSTGIGTNSGYVESLYFDKASNNLYIGGNFRNAAGEPFFGTSNTPYVFAIWNSILQDYVLPRPDFPLTTVPVSPSLPGTIYKIIKFQERIYVAGKFDMTMRAGVSSDTILSIGVWNNDIGLDSASNVTGQITNIGGFGLSKSNGSLAVIRDMVEYNGQLIVVGDFDKIVNINTGETTTVYGAVVIFGNSIYEYKPLATVGQENFGKVMDIIEVWRDSLVFGKKVFNSSTLIMPVQNTIHLPKLCISDEFNIVISNTLNRLQKISINDNGHLYIDHQFDLSEYVIIKVIDGRVIVESSIWGDITNKIQFGSTPGVLRLNSGDNIVQVLFTSTGDAKVHIAYKLKSFDGTVLLNRIS